MTEESASRRDQIDELAESFVARFRAGECPSIEEYARKYPDLADEVRELLPALVMLERHGSLDDAQENGGAAPPAVPREIGDFAIVREIGRGGMGVVYEAVQQSLGRHVALKVLSGLSSPGLLNPVHLERFRLEARSAGRLHHSHIVPVFGVGEHQGLHYYAMQFIAGQSLDQVIEALRDLRPRQDGDNTARLERNEFTQSLAGGLLSGYFRNDEAAAREGPAGTAAGEPSNGASLATRETSSKIFTTHSEFSSGSSGRPFYDSAARVGLQAAEALAYAHTEGVVHRDIKPSNLLLDAKGNIWVTDFGLAKAEDNEELTQTGEFVGTLRYMAPERLEGWSDCRSDLYGLGVTLYELLTLRPLFASSSRVQLIDNIQHASPRPPSKIDPAVPRDLETIVLKALAKEPALRYHSAQAMADDLRRFLADEPVLACPPSTLYRIRKLASRNKGVFVATTAAILVTLLGMITLAVSNYLIRQEQARTLFENERAEQAKQLAETRADEIRQGLERLKAANAWLERGRFYIDQLNWDDANAAFTKAVELRPDHVAASLERGELYARLGLWDLASADFSRAYELREPDTTMLGFRHALLRLSLGDAEHYRQIRTRMKSRFRGTLNDHFARELIRCRALGGDRADGDLERSVELAQNAANASPDIWFKRYILGIAQYRAGQHEQAVVQLRRSLTAPPEWMGRALSYPVLAMALHRLGQDAEARQALQSAADTIDHWTDESFQRAPGIDWEGVGGPWNVAWWDWVEFHLYYREAKLLIDGGAPSDDPRLHVLRARAFAALRQNEAADVEYAIALERRPDDKQVRLEAYRSAGYSASARQEWNRTAAEFTKASELAPDDLRLLEFQALALLAAGNVDGYRKTCVTLVERFEKPTDAKMAGDLVFTCVLRSDTLPEMARLLPLARAAATLHGRSHLPGAALYRMGQYEESVECFEKAAQVFRPQALEWAFLAMAHHRLGQVDEASRCLAEAARWIDEANRPSDADPSGTRPTWGRWYEPVVLPLLLGEAQQLLSGQ